MENITISDDAGTGIEYGTFCDDNIPGIYEAAGVLTLDLSNVVTDVEYWSFDFFADNPQGSTRE